MTSQRPQALDPHVISTLPYLILFPHSRCNCRCVMCDIWKVAEVDEISLEQIQRHLEDIEALSVRWVVFSGGEPLMHSDLFRLAALLRGRGIRTTILTAGLLTERFARQIIDSVDDVIVSLDGPEEIHDGIRRVPKAFSRLASGVAALRGLQADYPIAARTTVQKLNRAALARTAEAARRLRLDSISFLAADLTSTAFDRPEGWPIERQGEVGLNAEEAEELSVEIEALIEHRAGDIESGFIRESPEKLRRLVRHFRAHLGLEEPVAPRCNAPWVSAVVESDGTLRPCFFHQPIGNVNEAGLRAALNSETAVAFRRNLDIGADETCRRCVCSLYLEPGRVSG